MDQTFLYRTPSIVITLCLVALMVAFFYGGFRMKARKLHHYPGQTDEGIGALEGSLLGLLALLLSFTFSMSSSRHDERVHAMVNEANAIGTAIMQTDLYPDSQRTTIRNYFKTYLDARIAQYDAKNDPAKNTEALKSSETQLKLLWKIAVNAAKDENAVTRNRGNIMMGSLTAMSDAVTTRRASRGTTVPESILVLLFLLCLAASFIAGYGSAKKPDWMVVSAFVVMIAITVFSILDLDRPHRGLITLNSAEQNFIELRAGLQ